MPQKTSKATSQGVQLTPHFMLSELTESDYATRQGIDNTPNSPTVMANLFRLAETLELVRGACNANPVVVSSGYRSPKVNAGVGGSVNSEHMTGAAADIKVPGFGTPLQVAKAIIAAKIPFGQLIFEGNWVHISIADGVNDGQILTARFVPKPGGGASVQYVNGMPQ